MATTKVGGGVVDLNSDNTAFQMPVGSSLFTGTPVAGMIRNNSSVSNGTAQTTFEYYDGTSWVGMAAPPPIKIDFLVIAGGGAAGNTTRTTSNGGGGGAGGYRTSYGTGNISGGNSPVESQLTIESGTTYTVTVGAGTPLNVTGNNSSIIGGGVSLESLRGGMGMNQFSGGSQSGGSGGGASGNYSGGAGGTAGQGMNGGNGTKSGCGAGGGGASANGSNNGPSNNQGGAGGNGMSSSITGSSVTYAGGGGGASFVGAASGGAGGGGAGGNGWGGYGTAGAANTGGGGGGAPSKNQGAGGGSGIVVLRMPTENYSGTTTGSPTVTTDGTDTILIYNGSGSYTA